MADRKDSYFLQLVDEAFFDACFDDMEAADRALAVDIGFIGIVDGVVASQHSPTADLTIDLTSGVGYDQAGRRCGVTSAVSGLNCAVDENGASTAVTTPGNERWLSIQLRFDRTLTDLQVDGNGANVWVDQDESYELAVVMGVEQAAGTGLAGPGYTGRPALPADGRLVCDVVLLNGTTQILNADINTDRRQDFSIFSAGDIPVTSGAWTFLAPATDDIQAVFDFIDTYAATTNASREFTQNLIPSAAGRNLGEAAKEWDLYVLELVTVAASRVDGNLIPKVTGSDLGSSTGPLRWSLFADLVNILGGDLVLGAGVTVDGNLIPKAAGNNLGAAASEWDLFCETITPSATSRVNGNWIPQSDGNDLGSAALRWEAFLTAAKSYNTIGNFLSFSAAQSKTMYINITDWVDVAGTTDWAWNSTKTHIACSTSGRVVYIYFTIPDGVQLDQVRIRWEEATTTTVTAEVESLDVDNAASNVAGPQTIGGAGAARWDTVGSSIALAVDRGAKSFRMKVTAGSANTAKVYKLEVTYNVTGIDAPALGACSP